MVEFFQLIVNKPVEFLAGLGLSSATIYSVIRIIKWIIGLCTRKRAAAKETAKNNSLAELIISKMTSVDTLVDKTVLAAINGLQQPLSKLSELLTEIVNKDTCPVELKAYIKAVLKVSNSAELTLVYTQLKNELLNAATTEVKQTIELGEQIIEQEQVEVEQSQESSTPVEEKVEQEQEITYV